MDDEAHELLVRSAFPPDLANQLAEGANNRRTPRYVFHRQQLLYVAKEATLHCKVDGADPLSLPYWGGLGMVFLMANDHLHLGLPEPNSADERIVNTLAEFIPVMEYSGWHSFQSKVTRAHLMLSRFLERLRGDREFVDIPRLFEQTVGIPCTTYEGLCFGTLSKYMQMGIESFRNDPAGFLLRPAFFQQTAVQRRHVDLFLSDVSATPENLRQSFVQRNLGTSDFTWFRDRPLVRDQDSIYALDAAFLAEKLETGIFWRVHNSLGTDQEKQRLHGFWGRLFQEYANELLQVSVDGNANVAYPSPTYESSREQVCDAIVVCGSAAMLFEYKGSTFTAEAKYGGDPGRLRREIEGKLVGTEANPKGVRQLANAISRLFSVQSSGGADGVDLSSVRTVYPVLVTRDDLGGCLLVNLLLNRYFRRLLNRRASRRRITPLFCLSAEALEAISAYLSEARLADILHARYRRDRSLMSTFLAVDNDVIERIGPKRSKYLDCAFDEFSQELVRGLFPHESL